MFREIGEERAFNGILEQIIENIQNGSLKAGDALPAERNMAETMKVSRSAVREALRALELLGIIEAVPGGGNYITDNLDTWLIGPLTILFRLNHSYMRQNQQLRAALERQNAILAAKKCTPLDAAELLMILARIDAAENEKDRGVLDKELHMKIGRIADNPMINSVLAAADQLTENIISLLTEGLSLRLGQGAHLSDISARNEGLLSCAGQNQASHLVQIHGVKRSVKLFQHLGIQRVQRLLAADGDYRVVPFLFIHNVIHLFHPLFK